MLMNKIGSLDVNKIDKLRDIYEYSKFKMNLSISYQLEIYGAKCDKGSTGVMNFID